LNQLTHLWLSANLFSSVTPLQDLLQLEELDLDNNNVNDLEDFDQLTGLTSLLRLSLYGSEILDCAEIVTLNAALGTGVILGSDCL